MHHPWGSEATGRGERETTALWYTSPRQAELRHERLDSAGPDAVIVETVWTALSRGTERLVFDGLVPETLYDRMRAPAQEGSFPFPVKYGYCAVGRLAGTREDRPAHVFALQPHQDRFAAPPEALTRLPEGVPPRRAILAANLETALNAVWDSGAGPGDRIAVVGAGVVGLLVAYLCAGITGCEVSVSDLLPEREPIVRAFGASFGAPKPGSADVVFHASASPDGLALALSLAGDEARVVELSWYGTRAVPAPLGLDFHVRRLHLVSSQVGQVATSRRPRWSYARRMQKALQFLVDPRLDALITEEVAFRDLPAALPRLLAPGADGLCTAVRY